VNEIILYDFLKLNLYPDLQRAPGIYDAFDCTSAKATEFENNNKVEKVVGYLDVEEAVKL